MIHADSNLARRLEGLIRAEFRRLAAVAPAALPGVPAECIEVGSGVALWLGEGSPVNLAVGLGMDGPAEDTRLERVEAFYHDRQAQAVLSLCPLAHPSLLEDLGRRGWHVSGFEHLLMLELCHVLGGSETLPPTGVEVRVCRPEERELWALLAAQGLSAGGRLERRHEDFGAIMAAREDAVLSLAWVGKNPVATGALTLAGGVGWLSGDSTLHGYRRRGIQQAVQRHRLFLAEAAGCDLAVTEALPGGTSQRNMERVGFRVAYTHVEFVKD